MHCKILTVPAQTPNVGNLETRSFTTWACILFCFVPRQ